MSPQSPPCQHTNTVVGIEYAAWCFREWGGCEKAAMEVVKEAEEGGVAHAGENGTRAAEGAARRAHVSSEGKKKCGGRRVVVGQGVCGCVRNSGAGCSVCEGKAMLLRPGKNTGGRQ